VKKPRKAATTRDKVHEFSLLKLLGFSVPTAHSGCETLCMVFLELFVGSIMIKPTSLEAALVASPRIQNKDGLSEGSLRQVIV
jgi:hypothetical protein